MFSLFLPCMYCLHIMTLVIATIAQVCLWWSTLTRSLAWAVSNAGHATRNHPGETHFWWHHQGVRCNHRYDKVLSESKKPCAQLFMRNQDGLVSTPYASWMIENCSRGRNSPGPRLSIVKLVNCFFSLVQDSKNLISLTTDAPVILSSGWGWLEDLEKSHTFSSKDPTEKCLHS